jgi:hypothetical protein
MPSTREHSPRLLGAALESRTESTAHRLNRMNEYPGAMHAAVIASSVWTARVVTYAATRASDSL